MQTFIGTKVVMAKPMTRAAYNKYRGWALPENENGDDEGYLVEYVDGGKPNDSRHAGYISWSPTEVFDNAYKASGNMNFGHAIEALKRGQRVARAGWNGKGMWLVLVPGQKDVLLREGTPYAQALAGNEHVAGDRIEILPHIDMWTTNADGRRAMLPGWLASQTDMLSDDWNIV